MRARYRCLFLINHESKVIGMVNGVAHWLQDGYTSYIEEALKKRVESLDKGTPFNSGFPQRRVIGLE